MIHVLICPLQYTYMGLIWCMYWYVHYNTHTWVQYDTCIDMSTTIHIHGSNMIHALICPLQCTYMGLIWYMYWYVHYNTHTWGPIWYMQWYVHYNILTWIQYDTCIDMSTTMHIHGSNMIHVLICPLQYTYMGPIWYMHWYVHYNIHTWVQYDTCIDMSTTHTHTDMMLQYDACIDMSTTMHIHGSNMMHVLICPLQYTYMGIIWYMYWYVHYNAHTWV